MRPKYIKYKIVITDIPNIKYLYYHFKLLIINFYKLIKNINQKIILKIMVKELALMSF